MADSPAAVLAVSVSSECHSAQAGRACHDDGHGSCSDCGIALVDCDACGGIGYHVAGCAEAEGS